MRGFRWRLLTARLYAVPRRKQRAHRAAIPATFLAYCGGFIYSALRGARTGGSCCADVCLPCAARVVAARYLALLARYYLPLGDDAAARVRTAALDFGAVLRVATRRTTCVLATQAHAPCRAITAKLLTCMQIRMVAAVPAAGRTTQFRHCSAVLNIRMDRIGLPAQRILTSPT